MHSICTNRQCAAPHVTRGKGPNLSSSVLQRKPERGHFLAVTYEERIADDNRRTPRLAVEGLESTEFLELARCCIHESDVSLFRQDEQDALIPQ